MRVNHQLQEKIPFGSWRNKEISVFKHFRIFKHNRRIFEFFLILLIYCRYATHRIILGNKLAIGY